jgi:Na+/citrate or Na+/malate symporter
MRDHILDAIAAPFVLIFAALVLAGVGLGMLLGRALEGRRHA